jgi:hypothetical protein
VAARAIHLLVVTVALEVVAEAQHTMPAVLLFNQADRLLMLAMLVVSEQAAGVAQAVNTQVVAVVVVPTLVVVALAQAAQAVVA